MDLRIEIDDLTRPAVHELLRERPQLRGHVVLSALGDEPLDELGRQGRHAGSRSGSGAF